MAKLRAGAWGWIGLAAYVTLIDACLLKNNKTTLSEVFGDALRHPVRRVPVVIAWVLITLHLFAELLPGRVRIVIAPLDPIGALARLIEHSA